MVKTEEKQKRRIIKKESLINNGIDNKIIENFISLQRVMTNLAIKLEDLSSQISKLLELFEISAKTIADKDLSLGDNSLNNKISEKLDNLLEQNKVIAKGITLLHEKDTPNFINTSAIPNQFMNQYPQTNPNLYKQRIISTDRLNEQTVNQKFVRPIDQ